MLLNSAFGLRIISLSEIAQPSEIAHFNGAKSAMNEVIKNFLVILLL
jgi:hypothetical protein